MKLKRVVVTGLGALTPLVNTVSEYWDGLINGVSGADYITQFDTAKFKTRFACEVKNFDPTKYLQINSNTTPTIRAVKRVGLIGFGSGYFGFGLWWVRIVTSHRSNRVGPFHVLRQVVSPNRSKKSNFLHLL